MKKGLLLVDPFNAKPAVEDVCPSDVVLLVNKLIVLSADRDRSWPSLIHP